MNNVLVKSKLHLWPNKFFMITILNAMLSSGSALPKIGTRSHHLFGYVSRRSIIIIDSIPEYAEPW